jgi:DNA-binding NtrC family response regulator
MSTMQESRRVLVVDDENAVRASFDRVLSDCGYTVNTASDGRSAMDWLQDKSFDLAFVDLRMPGMDGMEVVKKIRATQPGAQVVIVTGYGTETTMAEAKDLGVFEFVAKPLAPDDLTQLAERALIRKTETPVETPAAPVPQPAPQAQPAAVSETHPQATFMQTALLLVRGSLLGLAYVMFLPFIGMAMLAWVLGERAFSGLRGAKAK